MDNNKLNEDALEQSEKSDQVLSDVIPKETNASIGDVEKKPRLTMKPRRVQHSISDNDKVVEEESSTGESEDEGSFDTYILENFSPFSGVEDLIKWLDITDAKFNRLKFSRKLRYAAIPLLVTEEAKRTYVRNKGQIKSYDDFYAFLLSIYDVSYNNAPRPSSLPFTSTVCQENIPTQKTVVFDDQQKSSDKTFDVLGSSPQQPILRSTALHDLGATDVIGDAPVMRSNIFPSHNSFYNASQLEQTTHALRRAIVDSLIKNPKTFKGGKEDVQQWLEDIEQVFDTAQIPESIKLDLVQHSLRGEALRWFKNNKSTLTSWSVFVKGLKEMFLSPFFQEIAFKKLESYSQGVNQPIRSFYNEVLKLCNEADPSMSDLSKLRLLLNKTNPTLQFEIRLKGPTTMKQYLDFAIEIEELFHLSNINTPNYSTTPTTSTITYRHSIPPPKPDKAVPSASNREVDYDNTYNNNSNYRNNNNNVSHPSQPSAPSNTTHRSNHRPRNSRQPPLQPVHQYSQDARNQQGGYLSSVSSSSAPSKANNSSNANIPSLLGPLLSSPPVSCSRCSQQGHQASKCPHF